MERHFALPATFAAAFHAALLFGYHTSRVIHVPDSLRTTIKEYLPFPLPPLDEDKPEPIPDNASKKGDSAEPLPKAPELPPVEKPTGPTMDISPHIPIVAPTDAKFDLRPPGVPDGAIDGNDVIGGPISIVNLDNPPHARLQGAPLYPVTAKSSGLTGKVMVEFTVDENGFVLDPRVVNSSDRVFEDATLRAVAKWRFEPGKRGGRIVRFRMAVRVVFNLNDN